MEWIVAIISVSSYHFINKEATGDIVHKATDTHVPFASSCSEQRHRTLCMSGSVVQYVPAAALTANTAPLSTQHVIISSGKQFDTNDVFIGVSELNLLLFFEFVSRPRRPGLSLGRVTWDLWWTKWHWGRFSSRTSVSPATHSTFTVIIIIIIIHHPGLVQQPKSRPTHRVDSVWIHLRNKWPTYIASQRYYNYSNAGPTYRRSTHRCSGDAYNYNNTPFVFASSGSILLELKIWKLCSTFFTQRFYSLQLFLMVT
jgi:hypothetical protein